eukprot:CAMPEP_0119132954 /NCGR_PEP_ID=MMETSP1310-20130426/12677_1 /TAXON_ID=464262 /ORGANISM="Genus nov. species nov., Strain RCC2339" /LENGTH=157 /DNA_ID=CAMNT_0007123623 /DNA_START=77 /DNA_END=550 /DNA_ORIENTATION=+
MKTSVVILAVVVLALAASASAYHTKYCTGGYDCCQEAWNCMNVFANEFANADSCNLYRECPLGYELLYDEELEQRVCLLVDQTVGFSAEDTTNDYLNDVIVNPYRNIVDCINTPLSDGIYDDTTSAGQSGMSYYPDYCYEPYQQALRACLFAIGRKG